MQPSPTTSLLASSFPPFSPFRSILIHEQKNCPRITVIFELKSRLIYVYFALVIFHALFMVFVPKLNTKQVKSMMRVSGHSGTLIKRPKEHLIFFFTSFSITFFLLQFLISWWRTWNCRETVSSFLFQMYTVPPEKFCLRLNVNKCRWGG